MGNEREVYVIEIGEPVPEGIDRSLGSVIEGEIRKIPGVGATTVLFEGSAPERKSYVVTYVPDPHPILAQMGILNAETTVGVKSEFFWVNERALLPTAGALFDGGAEVLKNIPTENLL